jgi:hypothetical protein
LRRLAVVDLVDGVDLASAVVRESPADLAD